MTQEASAVDEIKEKFDRAAGHVARSRWVVRLARVGYTAKGIVYIVAGALSVLTALGAGGELTDLRGSMHTVARQPFGRAMLGVVAFGLVAYVIWRWVQAITDADRKGRSLKGLLLRASYFGSGAAYAGLALGAARIVFGADEPSQTEQAQTGTARLMSMPYGGWLVMLAGVGVVGFGLWQCYKGIAVKFRKRLKLGEMRETRREWYLLAGRLGYPARGVVFIILGVFLLQAARDFDPRQARGLDGALQLLAQQSFGPVVLGVVAAGLVAYGLYTLVEARFRQIAGT